MPRTQSVGETKPALVLLLLAGWLPAAAARPVVVAAPAAPPAPGRITLAEEEYRDKVRACWIGRSIGRRLGTPHAGKKEILRLTVLEPLPEPAPNDSLDVQLVWLKLLRERGVNPSFQEFAEYWRRHLAPHAKDERGFCSRNLERSLVPPVSGFFENSYIDDASTPLRAELWACLAPGDPQLAAAMAWKDAQLDHAGGEGACAQVFWAALQSAAFVVNDPEVLVRIGLEMVPPTSAVSRAAREVLWCVQNGKNLEDARNRLVRSFARDQRAPAALSHGFALIGLLYGDGFGDRLCKAVSCGYHTDVTGATLGGLLGVLGGSEGIPARWRKSVSEAISLDRLTRDLEAPSTLTDLAGQTSALAGRVLSERSDTVRLGPATRLPDDAVVLLFRCGRAEAMLRRDASAATVRMGSVDVTLHYNGEPVLRPGIPKVLGVSLAQAEQPVRGEVSLEAPAGWSIAPALQAFGQTRFTVCTDDVRDRNRVTVVVVTAEGRRAVAFTLLGPNEARGYPSGENVPTCDKCGARKEACVCGP